MGPLLIVPGWKDIIFVIGTSTGGTMGKPAGRVGDSPLVGAGTYADETCAISATGEGESFIRACFAGQVADVEELGLAARAVDSIMRDPDAAARLAEAALELAARLPC